MLLLLAGLLGCGNGSVSSEGGRPLVVATTGMIADAAQRLLEDDAEVRALMGPQVDPHLYRASRRDVLWLRTADLVLHHGLHLEGRMAKLFEELSEERRDGDRSRVVAVAECLDLSQRLTDPRGGAVDPHVWMDVELWTQVVVALAGTLEERFPSLAPRIATRLEVYRGELHELHERGLAWMNQVPERQRVLITSHDAFRYFGRAYGLEVHGVQGISTESEPGVRDVENLVDLVVERQVPAVFFESSVSSRSVEALLEGARARGAKVQIGGSLYSDAMGAAGTPDGTYLGMLEHDLREIARALGAPIGGTEATRNAVPGAEGREG